MEQLSASTKNIPIHGLSRSPVRGIFSILRLHDLGMQGVVPAQGL